MDISFEEKDHCLTDLIKGVCRTAPASPGLFNITCILTSVGAVT